MVQRLDGIYFNTDQDFESLNKPILETYENCEAVIFQTNFNKKLSENYFGNHWNSYVIRNGTDVDLIESIEPAKNKILDSFESVWCCASSWRPHKRLSENIRYFLEVASDTHCLVVMGSNPDFSIKHPRVFYGGQAGWRDLISIYKRSEFFIHLAWLDHCPNVVVEALSQKTPVICTNSGGTHELVRGSGIIIPESTPYNFELCDYDNPPDIEVSSFDLKDIDVGTREDLSIAAVADQYEKVLRETNG